MSHTVAIFGPGLLGGSLLMALRKRHPAHRLRAWARRPEALDPIRDKNLTDFSGTDPVEVATGADLIVLCTPVGAMPGLVDQISPCLSPQTLLTDVGSVKAPVHRRIAPLAHGKFQWLGSHPMAGSEQSGIHAAREDLFEGSITLLTPDPTTPESTVAALRLFWESVGSRILVCSPEEHDRRVAAISHLPHLLSALLVNSADGDARSVAGPGFRDVTRIAAGPAEMWAEILLENKDAVLQSLDSLEAGVLSARRALQEGNTPELTALLHKACQVRRSLA